MRGFLLLKKLYNIFMASLNGKQILLIISGGIAAYKSLELIRLIQKSGGVVRCILTKGGAQFITPLSVAALSNHNCYSDLWSLDDEAEMGHIRLSRGADLVLIAPCSANMMAKAAHGFADDLASTVLLASDKPIMIAPAMNPEMWAKDVTQDNISLLQKRGVTFIEPEIGEMACGETGQGRMPEPETILDKLDAFFNKNKPLKGKKAIVTSGPTYEPIDPVRFLGNRSSGKQGHAIAKALVIAGAEVTLVSGPTALPNPEGVTVLHVETARQMLAAVEASMPADIAVCAAAVADYGVEMHERKQKKSAGDLTITLTDNPDILHTLGHHHNRPEIVVGFAAETNDLIENAKAKLTAKNCDMIVANQVAMTGDSVFGSDMNSACLITKNDEIWHKSLSKDALATIVSEQICAMMKEKTNE